MLDWNHERHKTRDRLLEYDFNLIVPKPCLIYQQSNTNLAHQLYLLAAANGYTGTEEAFIKLFSVSMNNKQILFASFSTFPQTGDYNMLYFDVDNKILYYWDNGYIPVNATLIADTILEGGGAYG